MDRYMTVLCRRLVAAFKYKFMSSKVDENAAPPQGGYCLQMRNGRAIDRYGRSVNRMDIAAFIPTEEYVYYPNPSDSIGITREIWWENIIDSLKQIASIKFQERGWIRGEIHDYCTIDETLCGLLNDSHFEDFIANEAKHIGLSDVQIEKLNQLRIALSNYECHQDPRVILKDPTWVKIREMTQNALKSLGIEGYLDPSLNIFKEILLRRIFWISDAQDQERTWIREKRCDSNPFQELMGDFFEICKVNDILEYYKAYAITDDQLASLTDLYIALKAYEKNEGEKDLQKILEDPEWQKIQTIASETLKLFDYKP
jgi:hypothetical protein